MENDYLWLCLAGVCVLLMLTGLVLLLTRTRRRPSGSGRGTYVHAPVPTTVHSIDDLPLDFERAVERPRPIRPLSEAPRPRPVQDFHTQRLSPDPEDRVLAARPVAPFTSWDLAAPSMEASSSPAIPSASVPSSSAQQTTISHVVTSTPVPTQAPAASAFTPLQDSPQKTAAGNATGESATVPVFDTDECLLLLKSHELLLTLSDGLKKLSSAKTEASRKEKLSEMMKAVGLLDAKNMWDDYKRCFDKINPEFWTRIEKASDEPMLPYELRLCALLAMGMSAKEAAELTNRSVRTVETSIYKIRKKLNIDSEEKTQDYLKGLL